MQLAVSIFNSIVKKLKEHPSDIPDIGGHLYQVVNDTCVQYGNLLSERHYVNKEVFGVGSSTGYTLVFGEYTVCVAYNCGEDGDPFGFVALTLNKYLFDEDRHLSIRRASFMFDGDLCTLYQQQLIDPL